MLFEKSQYNVFQVTADGFIHKGSSYRFDEITNLFFSRVMTTQRMNFVKVGEAESAYLHITLSSGKKIKLSFDESSLFMGLNFNKQKDIKNLIDLYAFLAEKTFANRVRPYLQQINERGYFEHDECRFYPRDKIVFRNKEFPIRSSQFLKGYGYIELRPKDYGLVNKIMREISLTKLPQFSTQTDSDVIFYLLEKHFGLKWS